MMVKMESMDKVEDQEELDILVHTVLMDQVKMVEQEKVINFKFIQMEVQVKMGQMQKMELMEKMDKILEELLLKFMILLYFYFVILKHLVERKVQGEKEVKEVKEEREVLEVKEEQEEWVQVIQLEMVTVL